MPITLTSRIDLHEIVFKLEQALQKPSRFLPIYILIWYLYTSIVLLLCAILLWVRLTWKGWTATIETLALPFVITLRIQVYVTFWTLESCCDILMWCWSCVDKLGETLERFFQKPHDRVPTLPPCRVAVPVEFLPVILGHLRGDRKSLLSCTYVSRLFHDEANRILWGHLSLRHGPDIRKAYHGLVIFIEPNIPLIDRRSLIRVLEIKEDKWSADDPPSPDDYGRLIRHLPSLKELAVENRTRRRMKFLSDYSPAGRPNLETISLTDNGLNPGFWAFVQVHDRLKVLRYSPKFDIAKGPGIYLEDPEQGNASVSFKPGTMPNLETVAAPASFVCSLVPGRPVKFVRIERPTPAGDLRRIVDALSRSTSGIQRLDLELSLVDIGQLLSRLNRLGSLEVLIMRCSEAYKWRTIAPDSGLPSAAGGFRSLRRLVFIFQNCADISDYYKAKVQPFQAACPRPTEVIIQGMWSTYLWSHNNDRWIKKRVDSKELSIEI